MPRCASWVLGGAAVLAMVAGCAGSEQSAAERAASDFGAALARRDTARACDLLAPATRTTLELDESLPCPVALGTVSLPNGQVVEASVWSGTAQIRTSEDTLFLTRTSAGWRIAAAGCRPQGEAPYQCRVEGS
jgi:hypothetical protein